MDITRQNRYTGAPGDNAGEILMILKQSNDI